MQFSKNIYDYNWKKLARWLIPTALRQPKLLAFVTACMSAVQYVQNNLIIFKQQTEYELTITGQVCYLEKALNDRWDFDLRRITITDGLYYAPIPVYLEIEDKPVALYTETEGNPQLLYKEAESAQFASDFIVNIPSDVMFDNAEMTALIKHYWSLKTFIINNG